MKKNTSFIHIVQVADWSQQQIQYGCSKANQLLQKGVLDYWWWLFPLLKGIVAWDVDLALGAAEDDDLGSEIFLVVVEGSPR